MKRWLVLVCAVNMAMSGSAGAGPGHDKTPPAKPKPAEPAPAAEAEDDAAPATAGSTADPLASIAHIVGPRQVDLGHHAQIALPAEMILLEAPAAQALMRKWGNSPEGVIAIVFPTSRESQWWVSIEASDDGYVSDSDADELDPRSTLEEIKQGTLQQNKERVKLGVPELFIDAWSEPPRYERALHHLVWGISAHATTGKVINLSTRFLGRNGFLSVDLVCEASLIEQSKIQALAILNAVQFAPGFRYSDHIDSDHDSGVGLKGLILGGTAIVLAKKTGILVAILLGLKKGIVVVVIAIGAFFKRLFGGKKREDAISMTSPPAAPAEPSSAPAPQAAPAEPPSVLAPPSDVDPPTG